MTKGENLWGGRFHQPPAELMRELNDSLGFDIELLEVDIEGSMAWTRALRRAGVLSAEEEQQLLFGLTTIRTEDGSAAVGEDIHSWVESRLRELIGPVAGKLHTGRSRNDQVATDLRLYLRQAFDQARREIVPLAGALASRARGEAATVMPGYTHLKRAEVVTFGHWCLAYFEMLLRDMGRFEQAGSRADECPLGAGALAGTPLPIDRTQLALDLGFSRESGNSLDAVSDRDAAADYLFAATMLLTHLSRLSEDLIIFSSDEFGFVELPDALATGSSRMPQKKNPDLLELVRGHAARSLGELTSLLALMKALPLSYNKDLQLDKEPVFRTRKLLGLILPLLTQLIEELELDRVRMRAAASSDLLLATELTDAIARRGVPFREAHQRVSRRIGEAIEKRTSLAALGPSEEITAEDLEALDVDKAVARKAALGGTSPQRVREAAEDAKRRLLAYSVDDRRLRDRPVSRAKSNE